jgi:hypothetical protein
MDSQQFRTITYPDFRPIKRADFKALTKDRSIDTTPIPDNRYPDYASVMQDARVATDYRTHCAMNVASPEQGNSLRSWYQHNGDAIIQISRKRQGDRAGAQFERAYTVPQPRQVQVCSPYECTMSRNPDRKAIGLERQETVPELFGTFNDTREQLSKPVESEYLTRTFEGGRNTPRGRDFTPLGNTSIKQTYGVSG